MHREKGTPTLQQDHSEETSPATQHTLGFNEASGDLLLNSPLCPVLSPVCFCTQNNPKINGSKIQSKNLSENTKPKQYISLYQSLLCVAMSCGHHIAQLNTKLILQLNWNVVTFDQHLGRLLEAY